ncbi:CopG family transcriptional regulator [Streptomyces rectiverticillatus]|uniref:CopG family transcriptional regulator n=1 Tax=Streptomyces rectiverticillatus TaxID=173860 RepID=UPI0015C2DE30|nr:CopG family transcriptional regulator [Streptomyces rectiverticillatus]QLE75152.1 CopG family transcriptional regulator [Streptomyces rectiverticillatus]
MSMNVSLRGDQMAALRCCAEREGLDVHDVVLLAVDEYLGTAHRTMVRQTAHEQAAKWRELMDRLK